MIKELDYVHAKHVQVIQSFEQSQKKKLQEELDLLQLQEDNANEFEDNVSSLMRQSSSQDFYMKSKNILSCNIFTDLAARHETADLIFSPPLRHQPTQNYDDFRYFLRQHLLGFFSFDNEVKRHAQSQNPSNLTRDDSRRRSVHSVRSVTSGAWSARSGRSTVHREDTVSEVAEMMFSSYAAESISAELLSFIDIGRFKGSRLQTFFTALFQGDSMWICGWNKNVFSTNETVLVKVTGADYEASLEKKKKDSKASQATIMFAVGDTIIFAKNGGSEVFSFHTQTHKFDSVYNNNKIAINAMCGNHNNVYILVKVARIPSCVVYFA